MMPLASRNLMTGGEDMWDDKELIRAYDKAVKNWRRSHEFSKEATSIQETPGPGPWVDVSHVVKTEVEPEPLEDENANINNIEHNVSDNNIHSEPSSSEEDEARVGHRHTYTKTNYTNGGDWENYNNTMPPPQESESQFRFPVPPMPISFSKPDGEFDFGRGELPSLLMSWYMAGYQAGFFDAKHEISKPTAASFRSRGGGGGRNVDRDHGNNGASTCQGPKLGKR